MTNNLPQRKRLYHNTPSWVPESPAYFITICCRPRGKNYLCNDSIRDLIWRTTNYYQSQINKWYCTVLLLMPDHLHTILHFPQNVVMKTQIRSFKSYLQKNSVTPIPWQEGFFDHRMRDSESIFTQYHYILQNPVRAGLCKSPEEWPYIWTPNKPSAVRDAPALPIDLPNGRANRPR